MPPEVLKRLGKVKNADKLWRNEFTNGYSVAELLHRYFPSKRLGHGVAMAGFQMDQSATAMKNNWALLLKAVQCTPALGQQPAGGDEDVGVAALMGPTADRPGEPATAGASEQLLRAIWARVGGLPHPMGKAPELKMRNGMAALERARKEEKARRKKQKAQGKYEEAPGRVGPVDKAAAVAAVSGGGAVVQGGWALPVGGVQVADAPSPEKPEPAHPLSVGDQQLLRWLASLRLSRSDRVLQQPKLSRWRQALSSGFVLSELLSLYYPSKTPVSHGCKNSNSGEAKAQNWLVLQRFCRKNRLELDEALAVRAGKELVGAEDLNKPVCYQTGSLLLSVPHVLLHPAAAGGCPSGAPLPGLGLS